MRMRSKAGFAMITVMLMLAVLMAMIGAYFALTRVETSTRRSSAIGIIGFYAAEGGLNLRAETIRSKFIGYSRPTGTSPTTGGSTPPCQGTDLGTADFACQSYQLGGQNVETYVVGSGTGQVITIPPGEDRFAGLNAIEYKYSVYSEAYGPNGKPSAIVQMDFLSRLVPLFQFAAFYQNDLEIEPSPTMTLSGPVHTNGDLYLNPYSTLNITGQVTTAGGFHLGQSPSDVGNHQPCPASGNVQIADNAGNLQSVTNAYGCPTTVPANTTTWGTMIDPNSGQLTVPDVSALNPKQGNNFWDNADLRVMVNVAGNLPSYTVENPDGSTNAAATAAIGSCADVSKIYGHTDTPSNKALSVSNSVYNNREGKWITMVNVDVEKLMTCIHNQTSSLGFDISESSNNGLVWYFGFADTMSHAGNNCTAPAPDETAPNNCLNDYGVRLKDGAALGSNTSGSPLVQGLTVVTNQAAYIQGDYNVGGTLGGVTVPKKPAAVIADSMNILSNSWNDAHSGPGNDPSASSTTVNAAFLSGTDVSGPPPNGSTYSGGLENYPRFHENWSGDTFTYRGSFVSLGLPMHVNGRWANQVYSPPMRDFNYDTDFNDVNNLPPLTPRFVYLKQLLFARKFSQ
jgi:hypothetical protein